MATARTWLSAITVGLLAMAYFLAVPGRQDVENRPLPPAVFKLRRINQALADYFEEHRTLPTDERGYRYALYQLSAFLDASDFQLLIGKCTMI